MKKENKKKSLNAKFAARISFTLIFAFILVLFVQITTSIGGIEQFTESNIVNVSSSTNLSVFWTGEDQRVFFCKTANCANCWYSSGNGQIETSGCYCYTTSLVASNFSCAYTAQESDPKNNNFYAQFYNSTQTTFNSSFIFISATPERNFTVNHRPNATSVAISPASPVLNSTLNCTYTFSDSDGDSEIPNNAQYLWWNGTGSSFSIVAGETSKTLSKGFNINETAKCSVLVFDSYNFSAIGYANSSSVTISNYSIYSTTASNIVQTVDSDSTNVSNNVTFNFTWSGGSQRALVCKNESCTNCNYRGQTDAYTTSGCYCYSSGLVNGAFSCSYNITESETGTRFFYLRLYNSTSLNIIDSVIADADSGEISFFANGRPYASSVVINVTSNLTSSTLSCNYTFNDFVADTENASLASYLWYNGTGSGFSLIAGETSKTLTKGFFANELIRCGVRVTDSTGLQDDIYVNSSTLNVSQALIDVGGPVFNLSSISNFSNSTTKFISFRLTDDFGIDNTSIYLNVTNSTSNTTSYALSNMSCTANATSYLCNLTIVFNHDGVFNLTFFASDFNNHNNLSLIQVINDIEPGNITNAQIGYFLTIPVVSAITTTKTLFVNWSALVGADSGIARYEYALGTGSSYGASGWDSVVNFTSSGTNTSIIRNFSIVHGSVYYFHIRAVTNSGVNTSVVSTSGILYNDVSTPTCAGGSCIFDDGAWINTPTSLHFVMNFTANYTAQGSDLSQFNYYIGNNTCFANGFDSVISNSTSASAEKTETGLNLVDNMTYYICARAVAANGRWSDWYNSDGIRVDTVAPTNGSISYTGNNLSTNTTTITLNSGQDILSGVGTVILQYAQVLASPAGVCPAFSGYVNYNSSIVPSSTSQIVNLASGYCYKFRYIVFDFAGNSQIYYFNDATHNFLVDTSAPTGLNPVINSGAFFTYGNDFNLNWSSASDGESGIVRYQYSMIDNRGGTLLDWTNTTSTFVQINDLTYANGTPLYNEYSYSLRLIAYNLVGLSANATSSAILYIDTTPPDAVSIVSVAGDTNSSDGFFDFTNDGSTNITVTGENGMSCRYSSYDIDYSMIYASACSNSGQNSTCSINATQGNNTYYITCIDVNGNPQTASQNTRVNWIADWSGPTISSISPQNGDIVSGTVNIRATISDVGVGTDKVWLEIRNLTSTLLLSANMSAINSTTYSYSWDSSSFNQTTYTISIYANDTRAQNSNSSVNVTINRNLPYLEVSNDAFASSTQLNISIVAQVFRNLSVIIKNSTGSVVATYLNNSNSTANVNYLSWLISLNVSNSTIWPDGTYSINITAVNNATNTSNSSINNTVNKTSTFRIDRLVPEYSSVLDTSVLTIYNNDSLNLTVTWTDANNISEVIFETNAISSNYTNFTLSSGDVKRNGNIYSFLIPNGSLNNNQTVFWRSIANDSSGRINTTDRFNFTVQNRRPVLGVNASLQVNASKNIQFTINLRSRITDLDSDNLTWNYINSSNITVVSLDRVTGIVTLNITRNWTGFENLTFNATDPYGLYNETIIFVMVNNTAPVVSTIPTTSWLVNSNTTISLSSYFTDANGDTLNYTYHNISNGNISIFVNATSGLATLSPVDSWIGSAIVQFNATDVEGLSTRSNNVTLIVYAGTGNSTLVNTTINGIFYENNVSSLIPGITNSTITDSNLSSSTVTNATIVNCTIIGTTLNNVNLQNCYINPSTVENSTSQNSTIVNSTILTSFIYGSLINSSTVINSTIYGANVSFANITNGIIYSGFISMFNGSVYNASNGAQNLTSLINYPPVAIISGSTNIETAGSESTIISASTDANILSNGSSVINDSLSYFWDFGDGTNTSTNSTSVVHTYSSAGSYTLRLVTTDRFNSISSVSSSITVPEVVVASASGGSGGGSGGGASPSVLIRSVEIELSQNPSVFTIGTLSSLNNSVKFNYESKDYTLRVTGVSSSAATITINSKEKILSAMQLYETKNVDLDGDGSSDVAINLMKVEGGLRAVFSIVTIPKSVNSLPPIIVDDVPMIENPAPVDSPIPVENVLPEEEIPYVFETTSNFNPWFWLIPMAVLLGGLYVLYLRKQQDAVLVDPNPVSQELEEGEAYEERDVDKFITNHLSAGNNLSDVISVLQEGGWSKHDAYHRVAKYVAKQGLIEGRNYGQIYETMIKNGWEEKTVGDALDECMLENDLNNSGKK